MHSNAIIQTFPTLLRLGPTQPDPIRPIQTHSPTHTYLPALLLSPIPGMSKEMAKDKALIAMVLPAIKMDHLAMDKYKFDPNGK